MKTFRILLGSSEGLLFRFVEVLVRDACEGHAVVKCAGAATPEEFVKQGMSGAFDLAILMPTHLAQPPPQAPAVDPIAEASRVIHTVKTNCITPILVVAAFDQRQEQERLLLEAGADSVLQLPFHPEELKSAALRLLPIPVDDAPGQEFATAGAW